MSRERRMNPKCLGGDFPDTFSARSAHLTGLEMRRITRAVSLPSVSRASNRKDSTPQLRQETAALRDFGPAYVACGSVASHPDLRDAPGMSAMPPIATQSVRRNEASRCAKTGREQMQQKKLFDHPVGADQEGLGDGQPERLRGRKVDDEIELNGLFDWKIRRLRAAQNPINITGSASEQVGNICPI